MDSMSLGNNLSGLHEREVTVQCEKHGPSIVRQFKLIKDWLPVGCPTCDREKTEEAERAEALKQEEQRAADRRSRIYFYTEKSGIPARFKDRSFSNYNPTTPKAHSIFKACRTYADNFPQNSELGRSLILCGTAGTGKTHLACAIATSVIASHAVRAVYTTIPRALRDVKDTYRKSSDRSEQTAIASFAQPDLLILDEAGVQYGTDAERNILFEIINERYESMKPTILISNLELTSLTTFLGERVIDRMKENGGQVMIFDWPSARGKTASN